MHYEIMLKLMFVELIIEQFNSSKQTPSRLYSAEYSRYWRDVLWYKKYMVSYVRASCD